VIDSYITLGSAVSVGEAKPSREEALKVYEDEFVRHYIEETVRFYKVESGRFLDSNPGINGLKEFLKKAELRLDEEQVRSDRYLHFTSVKKAMKECEKAIIGDRKDVFVQSFVPLLEHSQTADLARMYRLAKRVDQGLTPIRSKFEDFIVASGLTSMESVGMTPEPKVFVGKILHIYERFSRINQICFDNEFKESLDRAATKFINKNKACEEKTTLCPELVAKYCDSLLKRSNKTIDEPGTEEKFNQIMIVFKYIEDKDVFETHYSRMFANRLIKGTSGSDDAEESILQKLNDICGFEYTAKLNRMWQDINTSKGTTEKFKKALQEEGIELGIDFSVKLLSTGSWPLTKAFSMELPGVLSNSLRVFKEHYDKKNPRRTLTWLCSQSKGEITANYQSKNYVLVASTIQMAVLLLFNNENQLTVAEISRRLAVDSTLMQQVVLVLLKHQLLCLGPYPSLPETEGCDKLPGKDDLLSYNKDFFNKRTKITINVTYKIESHDEDPVTTKNIEADRKLLIQAAIVRIMKTRKQVNHQTLMSETINHLASRFKPSVQKIKACVEVLIEKEYIERVDGKDVYIYCA
jgi:cullin 1